MRTRPMWGLLALLASGCGENPESARFILGEAREVDGGPWRSGPLVLERSLPIVDGGAVWMEPPAFGPYGDVPVDPDGRYAAELFAFETAYWAPYTYAAGPMQPDGGPPVVHTGLTQQHYTFRVSLPLDAGVAVVETRDLSNSNTVHLPPLQAWPERPQLAETPGGSQLLVRPAPLRLVADTPEQNLHTVAGLEVRSDAGVLWLESTPPLWRLPDGGVAEPPVQLALFPELVESEAPLQVEVAGSRTQSGWWGPLDVLRRGQSQFRASIATPALPLVLPAGPIPASRGAACAFGDAGTEPCQLTNGIVEDSRQLMANASFQPRAALVQLGRPVQVRLVVLRNVAALGPALRAVGHTAEGESVLLARWKLETGTDGVSCCLSSDQYLRAEVPASLPAVTSVELVAEDLPGTEGPPSGGSSPPGTVLYAGEVSVFE